MPPGTDPPFPAGGRPLTLCPATSRAGALHSAAIFMSNAYHTHWHAQRVAAGLAEPDPEPASGAQSFTHLRDLAGAQQRGFTARLVENRDVRHKVYAPVVQVQRLLHKERVVWLPAGWVLPMPPVSGGGGGRSACHEPATRCLHPVR